MVRGDNHRMTASGIFNAHMAFEQPPECEGSEVYIPDPIVTFLKANVFADAEE
jgi:hypothetical protein